MDSLLPKFTVESAKWNDPTTISFAPIVADALQEVPDANCSPIVPMLPYPLTEIAVAATYAAPVHVIEMVLLPELGFASTNTRACTQSDAGTYVTPALASPLINDIETPL